MNVADTSLSHPPSRIGVPRNIGEVQSGLATNNSMSTAKRVQRPVSYSEATVAVEGGRTCLHHAKEGFPARWASSHTPKEVI